MSRGLAWFLVIVAGLAIIGVVHAYTRPLPPGTPSYCHSVSSVQWPECGR